MNELRNTTALVKEALKSNPRARNSDNYLYYLICKAKLAGWGVDITALSFADGLLKRSEYNLPAFETVRRSRQKIQQHNPELAGTADVEAQRAILEDEFRNYARQVVV